MADARFHDELRRYWDEIARGELATSGDLDPKLVETIRHLHDMQAVPIPDPAYAKRLRESVMHATAFSNPIDSVAGPWPNGLRPPATRRAVGPPLPISGQGGRWSPPQLATAALLLLALISSVVIFGPLRAVWKQELLAVLPASDTATPGNSADKLLVAITLPRDVIPDPFWADFWRIGISPGEGFAIEAGYAYTDEPGTGVDSVLAGQVAVQSEGLSRVLRAGVTEEVIAANTRVVLAPGDAWVYAWEQPRVYTNVGEVSVELLAASVYTPGEYGPKSPAGALERTGSWVNDTPASTFPPGPVTLVMRRLVPGPGTPTPSEITDGTAGLRLTIGEPMPNLEVRSPLGSTPTVPVRTLYVLELGIPAASGTDPP